MKIWIVTTEYPPAFGGGIGTYVENVASMYSKNGDKVKVILRDNVDDRKYENENLEVCRFKIKYGKEYSYMGEVQSMAYQYFEYVNTFNPSFSIDKCINALNKLTDIYFIIIFVAHCYINMARFNNNAFFCKSIRNI